MKNAMLKILVLCMAVCMVAGAFVACGKKEDVIVIGLSGPTTGPAATYG